MEENSQPVGDGGMTCDLRDVRFTVVADHREAASGVIEELHRMPGVTVRLDRLTTGDYLVDGVCLFERKSLRDLARSIIDGRLFSQAKRLVAGPLRSALILEGTSRDLEGSAMSRESVLGAIVSLTLVFGLPVLRSRGPAESARLLTYAAQQLRWQASDALPRRGKRPKGKRRVQLRLLQGLPGIGPDRATALLERFGSVQAVMTAAPEELVEVQGIGEKTAFRIREALE